MGDVVVTYKGKVLRFTHEDFARLGVENFLGEHEIPLGPKLRVSSGTRQIRVSHTSNVQGEEERFGGHNANFGDLTGIIQLFASSTEKTFNSNEMLLPDDEIAYITHEPGAGSIDTTFSPIPEQLTGPTQPKSRGWWPFKRKEG